MKRTVQLVVMCIASILLQTGQTQAELITTLFARNNGGAFGGTVYFDINVLDPNGITVEQLFTNTLDSFSNGNMNVYTRSGTSSGFQTSAAGWTLISSGSGTGAGVNNPTAFDVTDFVLAQGVTGIAIQSDGANWGHDYTNGNGGNQFYSNSDLALTLGSATNGLFGGPGGVFSPRVWNGSIQYTRNIPEPTTLMLFGIGIALITTGRSRR